MARASKKRGAPVLRLVPLAKKEPRRVARQLEAAMAESARRKIQGFCLVIQDEHDQLSYWTEFASSRELIGSLELVRGALVQNALLP